MAYNVGIEPGPTLIVDALIVADAISDCCHHRRRCYCGHHAALRESCSCCSCCSRYARARAHCHNHNLKKRTQWAHLDGVVKSGCGCTEVQVHCDCVEKSPRMIATSCHLMETRMFHAVNCCCPTAWPVACIETHDHQSAKLPLQQSCSGVPAICNIQAG